MSISLIALFSFIMGYVLYYVLRFNAKMKHKVIIVILTSFVVSITATTVIYFVVLYHDYPAYLSIMTNFVTNILGFCGGYTIDKLSDKYISNKINKWNILR